MPKPTFCGLRKVIAVPLRRVVPLRGTWTKVLGLIVQVHLIKRRFGVAVMVMVVVAVMVLHAGMSTLDPSD